MIVSRGVNIPIATLSKLRPDLTVPEVRTAAEWRLFKKMQENGTSPNCPDSAWHPGLCREVDMTRDRPYFRKTPGPGCVPLIEGRMVQPHRLGCKGYVAGEGRSALWRHFPPGTSVIRPQFWIADGTLSTQVRERIQRPRAGFCDITGQTNERSMMAALVPPGTVCGNKVPTIEFPNDYSQERIWLWLAVVNSVPVRLDATAYRYDNSQLLFAAISQASGHCGRQPASEATRRNCEAAFRFGRGGQNLI